MTVRYAGARQAGTTEAKIAAIDDESSDLLTPRERAGLKFAERLAIDHHKIDDAQWADLRRHFSEAEIIELVMHATLYIGFGRFNEVLGLEPA
jgi:alkylhydroperoxidase family enzyme